jgi:hypothetical protein
MNRYVGNLPPMPGVFPDYLAAVLATRVRCQHTPQLRRSLIAIITGVLERTGSV